MSCSRCGSVHIIDVQGKVSDMCYIFFPFEHREHYGYVPEGLGIGAGDYLEFSLCLNCGQVQDSFPKNSS